MRRVDISRRATVAQRVALQLLIEYRLGCGRRRWWRLLDHSAAELAVDAARVWRQRLGGGLGGRVGSGLHFGKNGLVFGLILPCAGKIVRRSVCGVGYGDHLMQVLVGGKAGELGNVLLVQCADGLAAVQQRAAWIVVQRGDCGVRIRLIGGVLAGVLRVVAAQSGAVGVVGGRFAGAAGGGLVCAAGCAVQGWTVGIGCGSAGGGCGRAGGGGCRVAGAGLGGARGEVRLVVIHVDAVDDPKRLGGPQGRGLGRSGWNELAVAEPSVVVGCGGSAGGDHVARKGEVERAQRNAGLVKLVDVAGGERERHGPRKVDGGVFQLAVDEE